MSFYFISVVTYVLLIYVSHEYVCISSGLFVLAGNYALPIVSSALNEVEFICISWDSGHSDVSGFFHDISACE